MNCVNERRWWNVFGRPTGGAINVLAYFGEEQDGTLMADALHELADEDALHRWSRIFRFSYIAGLTDGEGQKTPAYQVIQHESALSEGTLGFNQMGVPNFDNPVFGRWSVEFRAVVREAFGTAVTFPAIGLTAGSPNGRAILRETRRLYMRVLELVQGDPIGEPWIGGVALRNMNSLRAEGFARPRKGY